MEINYPISGVFWTQKYLCIWECLCLWKKFKAFENIFKISAHSFISTANDASGRFLINLTNYTHPENISTVKVVGKTMSDHWRLVR